MALSRLYDLHSHGRTRSVSGNRQRQLFDKCDVRTDNVIQFIVSRCVCSSEQARSFALLDVLFCLSGRMGVWLRDSRATSNRVPAARHSRASMAVQFTAAVPERFTVFFTGFDNRWLASPRDLSESAGRCVVSADLCWRLRESPHAQEP